MSNDSRIKIVGLCASPRRGGNTERTLKYFLGEAETAGAEVEYLDVSSLKVDYCTACENCMRIGKCLIQDDFTILLDKIEKADGIALASPNYCFDMSAQLKAVYDRSHCLLYYMRRLKGKYGFGICIGGHPYRTNLVAKTIMQGVWLCGGYSAGYFWGVSVNRDERKLEDEERKLKTLKKQARKFYDAVSNKKKYRFQDVMRRWYVDANLKKMVAPKKDKYPFIYEYYVKNIGLNNGEIA